jgi:nitroimidazol reductase NimA-like FMN-containing flavoprotein (pyridoxamine 5'-phosphate oxidase superfamily)
MIFPGTFAILWAGADMRSMRRKEREMPREFAEELIDKSVFGVMATVGSDGMPYSVPLSFAREGNELYFHCAREGHKIDNMKNFNRVCVSFVGDTSLPPDDFTILYESAAVFGTAGELTKRDDKIHALRLICQRYTPANMAAFDEAIERSLDNTGVWKIHIDEISGKKRKPR